MTTPTSTTTEGVSLAPLLAAKDDDDKMMPEGEAADNVLPNPSPTRTMMEILPLTQSSAVAAQRIDDQRHEDNNVPRYDPLASDAASVPTEGVWKDSTRDWCILVCCTMWCPVVALGQVMTRLRLDWLARPLPVVEARYSTCAIVTAIVALPWLLHMISFVIAVIHEDEKHHEDEKDGSKHNNIYPYGSDELQAWHFNASFGGMLGLVLVVWRFYITCQTRREIRRRHNIQEECCTGCEDCCCACCCPRLAIYQMSRHTGDFKRERAACCNATGLVDRPTRQLPPLLV